MSLRSTPPSQSPIAAMSPKPKSTSSMAATSPWTPPQTKSPHLSKDSSVLHARASRRGEQDEAALRGAGDPVVYWVRTFRPKGYLCRARKRPFGGAEHALCYRPLHSSGRHLQPPRNCAHFLVGTQPYSVFERTILDFLSATRPAPPQTGH